MITQNKENVLRDLQLTEKKILEDVVSVCEENHITYYLSSGSLLGAVRHKGFIPWDDDVDLEIPIQDYERFLDIAQEQLGDDYFVQTFMTDPNYHFAFARIRKNNTTCMRTYNRVDHIHQGVWIDIFPSVPVHKGVRLFLTRKWLTLCNFIQIQDAVKQHREEFQKLLGPVGMAIMKLMARIPMEKRQQLHKAMLLPVFRTNPGKCKYRANIWGNITTVFPEEIFSGEPQIVEFEGLRLKAPHDCHRYLKVRYGDYMKLPPVEERVGHGKDMIIDLENSYEKYMED